MTNKEPTFNLAAPSPRSAAVTQAIGDVEATHPPNLTSKQLPQPSPAIAVALQRRLVIDFLTRAGIVGDVKQRDHRLSWPRSRVRCSDELWRWQ